MSIRKLPQALQEVAIAELHEIPDEIPENLKYIKEWAKKQLHLKVRTDDQWLMAFLRGCKFSLEKTKTTIDYFYTMKSMAPELFSNRDPFLPEIQDILKTNMIMVLPVVQNGPTVILFRLGICDPDTMPLVNLLKIYFMTIEILMCEDDNFTVSGMIGITDYKDVSLKCILQCTPGIAQKTALCFQNKYPVRLKGIRFINTSSALERLYQSAKTFMTAKIKRRVMLYGENNIENIFEVVSKEYFPREYGGNAGTIEELAGTWRKKIESYRDWFIQDDKFGSNEKLRLGRLKSSEDLFGFDGSFKTMNID